MPVDADADPTGSFVCWTNERGDAFSRKARAGEDDNRTRHTSHFATCPHADSHRKR